MLVIDGVTRLFGSTRAVDGVSLQIAQGQFVGIIGRSGAGKSTLLTLINRLTEPSGGSIRWETTEVTALSGRGLRDWRRRCAMIFQQFNLVGRLDVLTNVLMGRLAHTPSWRSLSKMWTRDDRLIAMAALHQFDMASIAAQRADSLSGGQQQRVAICRALVQEPEIVLADEPVASLDLARQYCDRLVGLAAGRVVFDDAPAALTDDTARDLYGMEAGEVLDTPAELPRGAVAVPA